MLNTSYNYSRWAPVEDLEDFYRANLPEIPRVKGIINACRTLFKVPPKCVTLEVAVGERYYRILACMNDPYNTPFCMLVYCPEYKQLDLFDARSRTVPLIQWKERKVAFKNYPPLYDVVGFEKLFSSIVNQA